MNERQKIFDRLRKKELEIETLEDRLKSARVYVQALQDVLKLLDAEGDAAPATLKAGSAVAQAREAIRRAKKPLHINVILEALGRDESRESRASLTSSLAAYVRRNEIFTRPAPNTFGLSELGHEKVEGVDADGPPAGFGRIAPTPPVPGEFGRKT